MGPDALAGLRHRLIALRADVLGQLAEADHLDGGLLALVGNIGAALDALDGVPVGAERGRRAIITDIPGEMTDTRSASGAAQQYAHPREAQRMRVPAAERVVLADDGEIRLTLYAGAKAVAVVAPSPQRAISLAGELIAAASRRLDAALAPRLTATSKQHCATRGGDRQAGKRVTRDNALRDLAALLGADLSLEQRAADVIAKAGRYRPAQLEASGSTERQALSRIADAGLPLPGPRQLRRILTPRTSTASQHFSTEMPCR